MKKITLLILILGLQLSYSQNTCSTATPVSPGTYVITAIDGANISSACSTAALAEWYVYTPTQNKTVTVSSDLAINICKDTNFNVYTGTCAGLTCYAGDDDAGVIACNSGNTNSYLSKVTFDAFAGTTYYIAWDNKWSTAGFSFVLTEATYVPSPCSTATAITAGTTTVSTINGTNITTSCSSATLAKWYSYTPTQPYIVTVTSDLAANICKDTNFSVYTGSCTALTCLTSDDNSGNIACNVGNTNSNLSTKSFTVTAGTTYYIVWDNKWSTDGFTFQLTEAVIPPPPISYTQQTITSVNSSYNLCVVDMNNDHKDDIVGVSETNLRVHYQTPNAFSITDFPIAGTSLMPTWSMAAGDYNKDGYNDFILGNGSGATFWKSNSTGTSYTAVSPGQYIFCQRTNFIDINNDGHLDAFSCHDIAPNVYYLNNGLGDFTYYQSTVTPGALSVGAGGGNYATLWFDYDNDGDSDVFISKCSGPPCELHRNNGNGTFTDISAIAGLNVSPIQTWSSAIADFDNDGDMDIIITASSGAHKYFRNNLDTTNNVEEAWTNITAGSGWDTNTSTNIDNIAYDFDNDGRVDVIGAANKIMFNQGNGLFTPVNYTGVGVGVGAVGDLNNDGFLDILNGNIIKYAVPNGNNWIKIAFKGIQSNSNGIGARVEIYGTFGKQIRDVRSGEGFKYMSTLNAHFGIGSATGITKVVVKWPSGTVDTIFNPSINQLLYVVEGATLATENFSTSQFSLYPNPASDIINIKPAAGITFESVKIFDLQGRIISEPKLINETMSVQELSIGTYILLLTDVEGKNYSRKFVKK